MQLMLFIHSIYVILVIRQASTTVWSVNQYMAYVINGISGTSVVMPCFTFMILQILCNVGILYMMYSKNHHILAVGELLRLKG